MVPHISKEKKQLGNDPMAHPGIGGLQGHF